jgi:hypothetical protein
MNEMIQIKNEDVSVEVLELGSVSEETKGSAGAMSESSSIPLRAF